MAKTYVVTWAQNASPVHAGFLAALGHYPGELLVIKGRYKNPTSIWLQEDQDDQWWAPELAEHLTARRIQLCKNLCVYGDVVTIPTAIRPLSGWEVFAGHNSGILGHPKRALETIPSARRMPRVLATTGAITEPNYTDSRAGKRGDAHHVFGALVVEVETSGTFHIRQITADKRTGAFTDLDRVYTAQGVKDAPRALVLTLGDLHVGQEVQEVQAATMELIQLVQPRHLVLHDVLDFRTRNHHDKTLRALYGKALLKVKNEVEAAVFTLGYYSGLKPKMQVHVVRSNHDEALERWLEEANPKADPVNAGYWFDLNARLCAGFDATGSWQDAFAMEAERLKLRGVHFLARNEDLTIADVAYGWHGDKGPNGSRGSSLAYAKLGAKTVTGHSHSPKIVDGNYTVGVTAKLDQGYNLTPSSWAHAHAVQYADGKRALVLIVNGRFRAPARKKRKAA